MPVRSSLSKVSPAGRQVAAAGCRRPGAADWFNDIRSSDLDGAEAQLASARCRGQLTSAHCRCRGRLAATAIPPLPHPEAGRRPCVRGTGCRPLRRPRLPGTRQSMIGNAPEPRMTCRAVGVEQECRGNSVPDGSARAGDRHGALTNVASPPVRGRPYHRPARAPHPPGSCRAGCDAAVRCAARPRWEEQAVSWPTDRNCSGRAPESRAPLDACGSEC